MNRKLMFGISVFFAVLGLALVGEDNEAVAGRGCHGRVKRCRGYDCASRCAGRVKRCRGASDCCGVPTPRCNGRGSHGCDGGCDGGSCGGRKRCSGGLLARLRARKAARCRGCQGPSNCCGVPVTCCGPVAPAPCCEAAPAPCCDPKPCCNACGAPAPCGCGAVVEEGVTEVVEEGSGEEGLPADTDSLPEAPDA